MQNKDGLGVTLPILGRTERDSSPVRMPQALKLNPESLLAVPVTKLYDQGATIRSTELLSKRIGDRALSIHPVDAEQLGIHEGDW